MDKYEYKVRSEEIKDLIAKKKYTEAMKIADTIDWRRVKSVNMLCTISDLYKLNRRFEESREILLLAYERHPGGRMIVYSLCELSIKLDDVVQAVEYYKEFVQTAPRDNGRYILQYKLYEAQEVSLEERIAVLEELKRREYREKWAYELAYLYHRIGLSTKCIEECDELILWFGEGKYVTKAMELKMLHAALSGDQLEKYSKAKGTSAPVMMPQPQELDFEVPPVNVGEYATINLQKEIAEGVMEVLGGDTFSSQAADTIEYAAIEAAADMGMDTDEIRRFEENASEEDKQEQYQEAEEPITEEFNKEIDEEIKEVINEEINVEGPGDFTREIISGLLREDTGEIREISLPEEVPDAEEKEIFFEDTDTTEIPPMEEAVEKERPVEEEIRVVKMSNTGEIPKIIQNTRPPVVMPSAESMAKEKNENFDNLLSQEYDGQISLAVSQEETVVEKQITGQMSIEDILLEWERMKKENEEKRAEAVRQRVKEQTGEIFSQFNASTKQGLLAELDALAEDSIEKEKNGTIAKKSDKLLKAEEPEKTEEAVEEETQPEETVTEKAQAEEAVVEETQPEETVTEKTQAEEAVEEAVEEKTQPEENVTEKGKEESNKEEKPVKAERAMTPEEKKLFGSFIQTKSTRNQILETLDNISLASYTGNVILTGEPGMDSIKLAKNIMKEIQMTDSNFSGRMAKITGQALNNKDLEKTFEKLSNGALIVEGAGNLKEKTVKSMIKLLEQEKQGIIVILEDTKINMNKLLDNYKMLTQNFNLRIDIEAMDNDSLVLYGRRYAQEREYSIDELGVLALYTRIAELQTSEHSVTTKEVKEIVEEAIYHADKKNIGHFMDILFGKRYDDEDMIILREKDFV